MSETLLDPQVMQLTERIASIEAENKSAGELLVRIDERTKMIMEEMKGLKQQYVRKEEFDPIRRLVFGALGLAGASLISAMMSLVVKQ